MLRIISCNLNGIRSAATKGYFDWLSTQNADVVCVQELKAQVADLTAGLQQPPHGKEGDFSGFFCAAEKRGYSGVGLYATRSPSVVTTVMGDPEFDSEGRFLRADWEGLSVVSLYLPSGSSSDERQQAKFRFMKSFFPVLESLANEAARRKQEVVLCGDWNIAHRPIDLKNWRSNQKNSGFLPEEREWLSRVFDELGWVDVHRRLRPEDMGEAYTWWSNRGQAWANNVGWRIDYQIATPGLAATARGVSVFKQSRFSDHAPLIIDYDFPRPGQQDGTR